jgi:hypothetical protein
VKTAKQEEGNRYYIPADAKQYDDAYVDLFAGYAEAGVATFYIPVAEASGTRQRVTYTDLDNMGSAANRERANHISDYRFAAAVQRV